MSKKFFFTFTIPIIQILVSVRNGLNYVFITSDVSCN